MRIVIISDTHGLNEQLVVPDGDVLIHAGDLTSRGTVRELREANNWLGSLPHKHKIVIAGNHDFGLQPRVGVRPNELMSNVHYLQDEALVVEGLKFYGSPWQPWFGGWAFNLERGGYGLKSKWDGIPADTDVLITHGPAHGVLDFTAGGIHAGCELLAQRIKKLPNLRLHAFGHIHEGYDWQLCCDMGDNWYFALNASMVNIHHTRKNKPWVVDYDEKEKVWVKQVPDGKVTLYGRK